MCVEVTGFEPATSTMRTGSAVDSGDTSDQPISEKMQVEGQMALFDV